MEYPQKPRHLWRTSKLTPLESQEIKILFKGGFSFKKLSEIFNVSQHTIKRHVDEDFRKQDNERRNKLNKLEYLNEDYRIKKRKNNLEVHKKRYAEDHLYRHWQKIQKKASNYS